MPDYPFVRLNCARSEWMTRDDIQRLVDMAASESAPPTAIRRIGEVGWHTIEQENNVPLLESWLATLTEQGNTEAAATVRRRLAEITTDPTT